MNKEAMHTLSTPIETLIGFIVKRRNELGLSQRQLAEAAGINPGTLANIEVGRVTKAPTHETLKALAKGLRIENSVLLSIVDGLTAEEALAKEEQRRSEIRKLKQRMGMADDLMYGDIPSSANPTDNEQLIIDDAFKLGIAYTFLLKPEFWETTAAERRPVFRALETLIDETRRFQVDMKDQRIGKIKRIRDRFEMKPGEAMRPPGVPDLENMKLREGRIGAGRKLQNPEHGETDEPN